MHPTPAATTAAEDFGCTLLGILSALAVGIAISAYAYALHAWPAQTVLWSAPVFAVWFVIQHPLAPIALLAGSRN